MKEQTVKTMAQFILDNNELIDTHDLKQAYINTIKEKIKKEYGVYMDISKISYQLSFEENFASFMISEILPTFQKSKNESKEETLKTFQFYQKISFIGSKIWNMDLENNTIKIDDRYFNVGYIAYLLLYIINNELPEDMAKANEIEKLSGLKYNESHFAYTNLNYFGNIQVKKLKNGTLIFKGLTAEMKNNLQYVYDICQKGKNIR